MRNMYEIFDEVDAAKSKADKKTIIGRNLSPTLVKVLEYTYHPKYQWLVKELPHNFKFPDVPAGMSYAHLGTELRRLYLFEKGHPTAEKMSQAKRMELLFSLLNSLHPREAEVVMGIFNKDLGVNGINYKTVKEWFPGMLP